MKTVAHCSPLVPAEWIEAHGLRAEWIVPRDREASVEGGPLTGVCPYARAVADTIDAFDSDTLAVLATTCDQMRRAEGLLAEHRAENVFLLNVPSMRPSDSSRAYYADELRRLGRWLVARGGRRPDDRQLADVMLAQSAARQRFKEGEIPAAPPPWCNPVTVELAAECRASSGCGVALGLIGDAMRRRDLAIARWVHGAGARIVLDATAGGCDTLPEAFDPAAVADDPFAELVRVYFDSVPAVYDRPGGRYYEWLARQVADRHVRGLLCLRNVWCDLWHAALTRLKATCGVPILDIDLGDEDRGGEGRLGERLDAMIESLH